MRRVLNDNRQQSGLSIVATLALAVSACVPAEQPTASRTPPRTLPRSVIVVPPRTAPTVPRYTAEPPPTMASTIQAAWSGFPDRAGVAVMRADGSWMIAHRGTEYLPQQSVSKLWVAIAVMQAVDEGKLRLEDPVTVREEDLTLFNQPIEEFVDADGYETTIGALVVGAMLKSDNTANDVLLRKIGGPGAVRDLLAAKQIFGIRFGTGEPALQAYIAGMKWRPAYRGKNNFERARAKISYDHRKSAMDRYLADPTDGATPIGIARALVRLHRGELLLPRSTRYLIDLMTASETGKQRLRAGVPMGWIFAHKTGTGQDLRGRTAGYNDVGLMTAPDGTTYAIVVQIADTTRSIPERQAFMQMISSSVGNHHYR